MCRIESVNDDSFPESEVSFDEEWDWDPEFLDIHDVADAKYGWKSYRMRSEVGVVYIKFVHVDMHQRKICTDLLCRDCCILMQAGTSEKMSTVLERVASHHLREHDVVFYHSDKKIRGCESVQDLMTGMQDTLVVNIARK